MVPIGSAGCFYSTAVGELKCYENPKNKVTAIPAGEEEMCGAKFEATPFFFSLIIFVPDLQRFDYRRFNVKHLE